MILEGKLEYEGMDDGLYDMPGLPGADEGLHVRDFATDTNDYPLQWRVTRLHSVQMLVDRLLLDCESTEVTSEMGTSWKCQPNQAKYEASLHVPKKALRSTEAKHKQRDIGSHLSPLRSMSERPGRSIVIICPTHWPALASHCWCG